MVVNDTAHVQHAAVAYFHVVLVKDKVEIVVCGKCFLIRLRKVLATLVWTFSLHGGFNQMVFLCWMMRLIFCD